MGTITLRSTTASAWSSFSVSRRFWRSAGERVAGAWATRDTGAVPHKTKNAKESRRPAFMACHTPREGWIVPQILSPRRQAGYFKKMRSSATTLIFRMSPYTCC